MDSRKIFDLNLVRALPDDHYAYSLTFYDSFAAIHTMEYLNLLKKLGLFPRLIGTTVVDRAIAKNRYISSLMIGIKVKGEI